MSYNVDTCRSCPYSDVPCRVEDLALTLATDANFSHLRKSIGGLQAASAALDGEKEEAERKFRELLDKIPRHASHLAHSHPHPHTHEHSHRDEHAGEQGTRSGQEQAHHDHTGMRGHHCALHHGSARFSESSWLPEWLKRLLEKIFGHGKPPGPIGRFIEAAKRVQRANAKLIAFERGFISEEGIEGREWYKHLGVAPGRWLGELPLYWTWVFLFREFW